MGTDKLRIVAIGGGELRRHETLAIDRRVVELTGKSHPRALFFPTASNDSERYAQTFKAVYGGKLGCRINVLRLITERPTRKQIREMVHEADLIYVGGGNTLRMMMRWRDVGLDLELTNAAARGVVLSGLSAGAICWFSYGDSDSRKFTGSAKWKHIRVRGLGLVPLTFCPHYHSEHRQKPLAWLLSNRGGKAIACDDNAAMEIVGDSYRILRSKAGAGAYLLSKVAGAIEKRKLRASKEYRSLAELF